MSIRVICPLCGGQLLAPSQLLGRMAKCPQCGRAVKVIQAAAANAPFEPQERAAAGDATSAPRASSRSILLYSLVIAGSALGLIATVVGVVWLAWPARQIPFHDVPAEKPAEAKESSWADASKGPVRHGAVRVQLAAVTIRNIKMRDLLGEEMVSATKYLTLSVHILNTSAKRKIDFRGWSALGQQTAILEDDRGKRYQRIGPDPGARIAGQVVTAVSLDPGSELEELLVFERPVDEVQFLRLELAAAAFGDTGSLRFQIPNEMIRR
jgi:hypothetical protein